MVDMVRPKAVLFDLFETLISEFADGKRKVDRSEVNYEQLFGIPHKQFRSEWGKRQERRMTGHYCNYAEVVRDILSSLKAAEADEQVVEQLYRNRVREKEAAFTPILAEVLDLLRELKIRGIKLALVSNCTEEEVRAWPVSGLAEYFDAVLFSYEVGLAKPDERIYELACERLGVNAASCLFVGDGGSQELEGADQAGMRAYQAVWYVPQPYRRETGYPQLESPGQLLAELGG